MSKYKPTSRHQLYRQIYSAEDSLQYDHKSHEDSGECPCDVYWHLLNIDLNIPSNKS